jgi:hypothetical protein
VDVLVELGDQLAARAGVIFTAASLSFAQALATGARGGLSAAQDARVREIAYAVHELDGKIRGPEWGTFLASDHLQPLGGATAIEAGCGCEVIRRLRSGGMYLQLTDQTPRRSPPRWSACAGSSRPSGRDQAASNRPAAPWPPPMHIVTMP